MTKTLKNKFLEDDNLSLVDNIRLKLIRGLDDCDGMCNPVNCNRWYCEVYKQNYNKQSA